MPSGWSTAADVVNRAARRLALVASDVADPFASQDPNVQQLCALVIAAGERLVRTHDWTHLQKTQTFLTVNGTATYNTEADYLRTIDQTQWNRTSGLPVLGPVSAPGWQLLKGTDADYVTSKVFRVVGDKVNLHPTPTGVEQFAFEYISRYWVMADGGTVPTKEEVTANTDVLWFDRHLLVCALMLEWRGEKGFDTSKAQSDFDLAFAMACGGDGVAPVLPINGGGLRVFRLIDGLNLPSGGT